MSASKKPTKNQPGKSNGVEAEKTAEAIATVTDQRVDRLAKCLEYQGRCTLCERTLGGVRDKVERLVRVTTEAIGQTVRICEDCHGEIGRLFA